MAKRSHVIIPILIFIVFIVSYIILSANSYGMYNFRFLIKSNNSVKVNNDFEDEYLKLNFEDENQKTVYFTRLQKNYLYLYKYDNGSRNITNYTFYNPQMKPMKDEIGNSRVIIAVYDDSGLGFSTPIKTYIINP